MKTNLISLGLLILFISCNSEQKIDEATSEPDEKSKIGSESSVVSTTFTFTELPGINHVSFDFEEGDHAVPGVYDRSSWYTDNN